MVKLFNQRDQPHLRLFEICALGTSLIVITILVFEARGERLLK